MRTERMRETGKERMKEIMKERKKEREKEGKKKGKKADEGKLVGTDMNGQGRKEGREEVGTLPHEMRGTRTRCRLRLSLSSKRGKSHMRSM